MDTGTLELVELEHLLDHEYPCSNDAHASGQYGHKPDEGAAWIVTAPCGTSEALCDSSWALIVWAGGVNCPCDGKHRIGELVARPI